MDIEVIKSDIYDILSPSNILAKDTILKYDTLLNEYGLDSVGIVELIIIIEEKYGFEFSTTDLILKDFESINSVSLLVHRVVQHRKQIKQGDYNET